MEIGESDVYPSPLFLLSLFDSGIESALRLRERSFDRFGYAFIGANDFVGL